LSYWDRRRPGGTRSHTRPLLRATSSSASACRRDGGGPSGYGRTVCFNLDGLLERDARERAHATLVVEREALRVAYINVDVAAQALMDVEHSQRFLLKGQTEEARNKQLNAYLTDATKEHARTMAALRLASNVPDIPNLYSNVWKAFVSCTTRLSLNREQQETGALTQRLDVGEAEEALEVAVAKLREAMRKHLQELEQTL